MRVLLDDISPTSRAGNLADLADLADLYAVPEQATGWLRANFVSTLDGAATGADGVTGSINTEADHVVFELLRATADAVLVGAGTLRIEGYGDISLTPACTALRADLGLSGTPPLVVISAAGSVPPKLLGAPAGRVLMLTHAKAVGLAASREALGEEHIVVAGEHVVDLRSGVRQLHERGLRTLLTEGGPHLLGSMLEAGVLDELDLTLAPRMVSGGMPRIAAGTCLDLAYAPRVLLERDGSIIGRWLR